MPRIEIALTEAGESGRAASMVEVVALAAPEEVEADAYSPANPPVGGKVPSAVGR